MLPRSDLVCSRPLYTARFHSLPVLIMLSLAVQPDAPKSAYVQIPSSTMYSIGWLEDSEDAVSWSGGKSGWFEIQPAAEYRAMNDTVCEGITLYYFLLDSYTDAQSRAGKSKRDQALLMPVKELLKKVREVAPLKERSY